MQATDPNFNPAYSTIKAIYLSDERQSDPLNIIRQNSECVFERIEFVENANDVFPNGVLIVRDTKDIVSRVKEFQINKIYVEFFNSDVWNLDITSVSHINNAASETEENFVGIYFSNSYYKLSQSSSLNQKLGVKKPNVLFVHSLVDSIKRDYFGIPVSSSGVLQDNGYSDKATNYALYKPLNEIQRRDEMIADNGVEYLNYLTTAAIDAKSGNPSFMFWTNFDGSVNFKAFQYDLTKDSSFSTIDGDVRRFAIFDGESVIQQLSDRKFYRKIYFYNTDPAYQFISKNYYYIRKTPKVLDVIPSGLCAASGAVDKYNYTALTYQYQDEGERYNIEVIDQNNTGIAPVGGDQLIYDKHWGNYDGLDSINWVTQLTHFGQNFGTESAYKQLNLMGSSGYMPYVDNTEMWKNMFDLTPIHPNFPTGGTLEGTNTNLQKVINGRYEAFLQGLSGAERQLQQFRQIELQNFVGYVLCCMGKKDEDCFFAVLQRYETDSSTTQPSGSNIYRYKWNKLIFGNTGASGSTGFHKIENWALDTTKSSANQDSTWAINLNERGLTAGYLAPGWVSECIPTNFKYRAIGAKQRGLTAENIFHIAKVCRYSDGQNSVYYFTAENVVDGCCDNGTP